MPNLEDKSDLMRLCELYETALAEHAEIQVIIQSSNFQGAPTALNAVEERGVEIGLRLDKIENNIVSIECYDPLERLEYIKVVLGILARRENLTEHPLVNAMNECLQRV